MIRLAALAAVLAAVYVAGLGLEPRAGAEYLRTADTLVADGVLVRGAWGLGFPLVIAPAEAVGGAPAVELFLVAVAVLGFVLGALLARRIVPEPYASAGAALTGLSAPAIVYAGEIGPEMTAGALLAGATLCTAIAREAPRPAPVFGAAAMLAVLPWLDPRFVVPALPVAAALYLWCRHGRRPTLGLIAVELAAASIVLYATLNERLYGGPTPWSWLPGGVSATGHGRRARRARAAARHAVGRSRRRAAALGAGPGLRVLRGLAAGPLAPGGARARRAHARGGRGRGGPSARGGRRGRARRRVPDAGARHRAVLGAPPRPRAAGRRRAGRLGAAARAAGRRPDRRRVARAQRRAVRQLSW